MTRQQQPVVPGMLDQTPVGFHQPLLKAGQRPEAARARVESTRRKAMRLRAVDSRSCSVMPKKARNSRNLGRKGIALPCATPVGS